MFALYLLSFLTPSHSAITRSTYLTPQCTGEALGGNIVPENVCYYGRKITCNTTHVYSTRWPNSDCTGTESVVEEPLLLHACINNTRFSCGESSDFPENSIYEARWTDSNCQGSLSFQWSKLNVCVPDPDGRGRSAFLTYEANKKPIATYYRSKDCTGESQEGPLGPGGGDTVLYNTQEQQISNTFYVYEYADENCNGEPYQGSNYQPSACGAKGRMTTCENNQFILASYNSADCTEKEHPRVEMNLTTGQCIDGKKSFCAGTFTIPANSLLRPEFDGSGPCKVVIGQSFTRTEVCKKQKWSNGSEMLTFNATTKQFYSNSYQTIDCTGEASQDSGQRLWTNYGGINAKPRISS